MVPAWLLWLLLGICLRYVKIYLGQSNGTKLLNIQHIVMSHFSWKNLLLWSHETVAWAQRWGSTVCSWHKRRVKKMHFEISLLGDTYCWGAGLWFCPPPSISLTTFSYNQFNPWSAYSAEEVASPLSSVRFTFAKGSYYRENATALSRHPSLCYLLTLPSNSWTYDGLGEISWPLSLPTGAQFPAEVHLLQATCACSPSLSVTVI